MGIQVDILRINGFRGIENLEITLPKVTVLFGQNNTGKTSIIKALQLVLGDYGRYLSNEDFYIDSEDNKAEKIVVDIRIIPIDIEKRKESFGDEWVHVFEDTIQFDLEGKQYVALRVTAKKHDTIDAKYVIEREYLTEWKEFDNWLGSPSEKFTKRLDNIAFIPIDAQRDIHNEMKEKSSFIGRVLSNISYSTDEVKELEKSIAKINQDAVAKSPNLRQLKVYLDELSETTLGHGKTEITPFPKKIRDLSKNFSLHFGESDNSSFSMEYHGMGTRSWASMLTVKAFSQMLRDGYENDEQAFFSLIAAEEPEAHLHPNAQRTLYNQLANMENQVIVSTHSPYLIGMAEFHQLRALYKKNTKLQCYQLNNDLDRNEKHELKRGMIRTNSELFFSKAVLLAEGVTEEQVLPALLENYFGKSCSILGINCVGVNGKKYAPFIKLAVSFGIPVSILSDNDGNTSQEINNQINKLKREYNKISNTNIFQLEFLGSGNDLEAELLQMGLREELIEALILMCKGVENNSNYREAKKQEFQTLSDSDLLIELRDCKAEYGGLLADVILENPYNKDFRNLLTPAFKQSFEKIAEWITP